MYSEDGGAGIKTRQREEGMSTFSAWSFYIRDIAFHFCLNILFTFKSHLYNIIYKSLRMYD